MRKMWCLSTKFFHNRARTFKYAISAILLIAFCEYMGLVIPFFETDYYTQFTYPLDVDIQEIIHALKSGRKPTVKPLDQYNFRFKIENANRCRKDNENNGDIEEIVVLLLVKSAIGHRSQRDAIRRSWGFEERFSDVRMRRVFVMGEDLGDPLSQDDIDGEYKEHRDIVQSAFSDTYYNNTIKTMVAFNWVVKNCNKARYILLVDDDYYISVKNLLRFLRNPLNLPKGHRKLLSTVDNELFFLNDKKSDILQRKIFDGRLYAGCMLTPRPLRHKPSKWYVSLKEYPFSRYPPYVTAGAVAMNYLTVLDMHYTSMYTKHFRFDDVYIGILAKKAGIEPINNDNFYFWPMPYDRNSFSKVIAAHGFGDPRQLVRIWEEQKSLGNA